MSELRVLPPNLREETELGKGAAGRNDQEYEHWDSVQRTQAHLCHFSFELVVFTGKNKRSNTCLMKDKQLAQGILAYG